REGGHCSYDPRGDAPGTIAGFSHRAANQESEGRVSGHRIILLCSGKSKKAEDHQDPAQGEQANLRSPVRTHVLKPERAHQKSTPREEPGEMQEPEPGARDGVVVARVAEVQKTEKGFIEEVEPEEAVILAGRAVHREIEVRRVAQRGENMPWGGDREQDATAGA